MVQLVQQSYIGWDIWIFEFVDDGGIDYVDVDDVIECLGCFQEKIEFFLLIKVFDEQDFDFFGCLVCCDGLW